MDRPSSSDRRASGHDIERLIGRRAAERILVHFPAQFATSHQTMPAAVIDVSASGARLRASPSPDVGAEGSLLWEGIECQCLVIWRTEETFGVQFLD